MQQIAQLAFLFPAGAQHADVIAAVNAHFQAPAANMPWSAVGQSAPEQTPVAAAAAQVVAAAPAAAGGNNNTQVDSRGLPWDARIHGNPPTLTEKDKIWRKKRGVDDALVAQVEQELRGMLSANAAAAPVAAPAATPANPALHAAQQMGMIPPGCPIDPEAWASIQAGHTVMLNPGQAEWLKNYSMQTMQQQPAATQQTAAAAAFQPPATPAADAMAAFGFATPAAPAAPARVCPFDTFETLRDFILANANSPANPAGKLTPVTLMPAMQVLGVPNGNMSLLANMPNLWDTVALKVDQLMAA